MSKPIVLQQLEDMRSDLDTLIQQINLQLGDGSITVEQLNTAIASLNANKAPLSHVGAGGSSQHPDVTSGLSGFMTPAQNDKLAGIEAQANKYIHPTGDGNQHVPATGTSNDKKVLKSGATAGSAAWANVDFSELTGTSSVFTASNPPTRDTVGLGATSSPTFKDLIATNSMQFGNIALQYNSSTKSLDVNVII